MAATIARVLSPYRGRIKRAALFGSRATGRARPGSDVDLALWGEALTGRDMSDLFHAFDESDLPVTVDLVHVETCTSDDLRRHIEAVAADVAW
ncbi:MAG: nucleotidyltransferase domain-containing protein [Hyphomonadaceae bacterium]|jgi:predicted nucleotidyltransferase|nr:nucleotidyltransferase domain-containing protein [Hyphomonadaceae bacterium]